MPIRFERWMRSKLSAMTARRPAAACPSPPSRGRAGAVFLAGENHQRRCLPPDTASRRRRWTWSSPSGSAWCSRLRCPATSWFLSRMFANVPRIITSWLPRREPYELKSAARRRARIEIVPGGAVLGDVAGRRNVVGGHANRRAYARMRAPRDVGDRLVRSSRHVVEERRLLDVGRVSSQP